MSVRVESPRIGLFSSCLPGWDALRVIDVAVALGFSTVEWGSGPGHAIECLQDAHALRQLCERAGLRSGGLSVQDPEVTFATPERAAPHLTLALELGAPHVRLLAPRYAGGSLRREQQRVRDGLDFLVGIAAPSGLAVLVETSPATLAPGPDLAAALVEHHPAARAGVLYDPGNMAVEGHLSPEMAIARLGRHLRHVHVKNIAWSRQGGIWRWRHASLTKGMLDWPAILHRLASARYDGGFSIDHLGGVASAPLLRAETSLLRTITTKAFAHGPDQGTAATTAAKGALPSSLSA